MNAIIIGGVARPPDKSALSVGIASLPSAGLDFLWQYCQLSLVFNHTKTAHVRSNIAFTFRWWWIQNWKNHHRKKTIVNCRNEWMNEENGWKTGWYSGWKAFVWRKWCVRRQRWYGKKATHPNVLIDKIESFALFVPSYASFRNSLTHPS